MRHIAMEFNIAQVWHSVRETEVGLLFLKLKLAYTTVVAHISGSWMTSFFVLNAFLLTQKKKKPRKYGTKSSDWFMANMAWENEVCMKFGEKLYHHN